VLPEQKSSPSSHRGDAIGQVNPSSFSKPPSFRGKTWVSELRQENLLALLFHDYTFQPITVKRLFVVKTQIWQAPFVKNIL